MVENIILYEEARCWIVRVITFLNPTFGKKISHLPEILTTGPSLAFGEHANLIPLLHYSLSKFKDSSHAPLATSLLFSLPTSDWASSSTMFLCLR